MNSIDKLKKHLSKNYQLKLKNDDGTEDIFEIKPLNMAEQTMAYEIYKNMKKQGLDENSTEVSPEFISGFFDLFKCVLNRSFEGVSEEDLENFITTNFEQLMLSLENLMPSNKSNVDLINKRKEQIENAKRNK